MSSLDEKRQDIEILIDSLRQAVLHFENVETTHISSSPVELLLEAAIDISLLLGEFLIEGRQSVGKNPELIFSEFETDALGNPKQKVVYKEDPPWIDPETGLYLKRQVASFFVALKNRQSLPRALKALELAGVDPSTEQSIETVAQKNRKKQQQRLDALKKKRQEQYFRRRQRKLKS